MYKVSDNPLPPVAARAAADIFLSEVRPAGFKLHKARLFEWGGITPPAKEETWTVEESEKWSTYLVAFRNAFTTIIKAEARQYPSVDWGQGYKILGPDDTIKAAICKMEAGIVRVVKAGHGMMQVPRTAALSLETRNLRSDAEAHYNHVREIAKLQAEEG